MAIKWGIKRNCTVQLFMTSQARSRSEQLVDELSDLDQRSGRETDDVSLLKGMRDGLSRLVESADGNLESIREMLVKSRDKGELRQETFELVTSMLDSYRTEHQATIVDDSVQAETGAPADIDNESDDEFASTMVISKATAQADQPERSLQVGSVLRDRFLLQEQVSGGSMGIVFKALDRRLAETGHEAPFVAIKVISPVLAKNAKALRALQQEAAKGRCLTHNHIVRFLDFDRDDGLHFIVMEWLDGENLADMLDRGASMDAKRALKITQQVGQALGYAHRCGIVHADIKPANVMILPNGDAKLFDFGVARARQSAEQSDHPPGDLGAMTPAYSSMQVLTGEEPAPEDDVFSLACLYYRLVAGYRVFGPRNAAEAAEAGMTPQPLQGVSDDQWKAVKKALSFARVTRYASVDELLDDLTPAEGEEIIAADPGSRIELEPVLPGSSKGPWLALVVVILLAGAAAYFGGFLDPYLEDLREGPSVPLTQSRDAPEIGEAIDASNESVSGAGVFEPGSDDDTIEAVSTVSANKRGTGDESSVTSPEPAVGDDKPEIEEAVDGPVESQDSARAERMSEPRLERFREIPPGDVRLLLEPGVSADVVLEESAGAVALDVIRTSRLDSSERVFVQVAEYSGNRSPIETGDLAVSPSSVIEFPPGVDRMQLELSTRDDPLREADQTVTLLLQSESGVDALINIELIDDDQRRFEASLPANTVAFAAGQVSVEERDAAVQLDVVRFKPDQQPLTVYFTVSDVTATADADYFPPASSTVEFAPGQRIARILVPLVQDTEREGNEAFVLELISSNQVTDAEIYQRIAVMIRDDD